MLLAPGGGKRGQAIQRVVADPLHTLAATDLIGDRADDAGMGRTRKAVEQVREPMLGHHRVIVQEQHELAVRGGDALIATAREALIRRVGDQAIARVPRHLRAQPVERAVAGAVVHEHDVVGLGRMTLDAGDALLRGRELVERQDDDGHHARRHAVARRGGCERGRFRQVEVADARTLRPRELSVAIDNAIGQHAVGPALVQSRHVLGDLDEALLAALRLVVRQHAGRLVHQQPPVRLQPEAQVHVFIPVPVALVEAAGLDERGRSHEQARGGERLVTPALVRVGRVGCGAVMDVPGHERVVGHAVVHDHHPGMLQRAVREQQLAADRTRFRAQVQHPHEWLQPAGVRLRVVVQEQHIGRVRRRGAEIARTREAEVVVVSQQAHVVAARADVIRGAVRGTVVHDDDLRHPLRRVLRQGVETGARQLELVEHRNDDGHARFRHSRGGGGDGGGFRSHPGAPFWKWVMGRCRRQRSCKYRLRSRWPRPTPRNPRRPHRVPGRPRGSVRVARPAAASRRVRRR